MLAKIDENYEEVLLIKLPKKLKYSLKVEIVDYWVHIGTRCKHSTYTFLKRMSILMCKRKVMRWDTVVVRRYSTIM
jgi:hypothetical protein